MNVYGSASSSFATGRHLSRHKVWLQRPDWNRPGYAYSNPHVIKFDNLADGMQDATTEAEETDQSEEENLQGTLEGVYSKLTRDSHLDSSMAEDLRLRTQLMPHQIKAQNFMVQKENGPIPEQFQSNSNYGRPCTKTTRHGINTRLQASNQEAGL